MQWTKVTDALPPDGEAVMVTANVHHPFSDAKDDFKMVVQNAFWREDERRWYQRDGSGRGWLPDDMMVTHWMAYPLPAEAWEERNGTN